MTDTSQQLIEALDAQAERRRERREFFRTAFGAAAAAAAGAGVIGLAENAGAATVTDADVLNFALTLEYLDANFYSYVVYGAPISSDMRSGTGTQGDATGGRQVAFADATIAGYAKEIAADAAAHVSFLRAALGSSAVAQPTIDLSATAGGAFSTLAAQAGVVASGGAFDPYASDTNFLLAAFMLEDVMVNAYKGGAPFITNASYLEVAGGLLGDKAYHAGLIRTTLYSMGQSNAALITNAGKISDARDALDGSSDFDQGIAPVAADTGSDKASNIAPLDGNGLVFSRSYNQVLNVFFLNKAAVTKGGFYPNGVNGTINTSADNS